MSIACSQGLGTFKLSSKEEYSLRMWENLSYSSLCSSVPWDFYIKQFNSWAVGLLPMNILYCYYSYWFLRGSQANMGSSSAMKTNQPSMVLKKENYYVTLNVFSLALNVRYCQTQIQLSFNPDESAWLYNHCQIIIIILNKQAGAELCEAQISLARSNSYWQLSWCYQ